jgi:hypothetical protein
VGGKPVAAFAPLLETLLKVDGGSNVVVGPGLTFEHTAWHLPSSNYGYVDVQAGAYTTRNLSMYLDAGWEMMPAAVTITGSTNTTLLQCTLHHLGGAGASVGSGSVDSGVEGCFLTDVSGNGIQLGGISPVAAANATADALRLRALNNRITYTPAEYHGAVGIFGGYLASGLIAHNALQHFCFSVMIVGGGWGGTHPDGIGNNRVHNNSILDFCELLNDCGGVYTLGYGVRF